MHDYLIAQKLKNMETEFEFHVGVVVDSQTSSFRKIAVYETISYRSSLIHLVT